MARRSNRTLSLPGGPRLVVRPVLPADRPALGQAFARLSADSLYRRFMSPKPTLTSRELTFLTEVDHGMHEALLALDPCTGEVAGEVRYVVSHADPHSAEIAFTVFDGWQGRGIGRDLGRRIVAAAREAGIERLTATTLAVNHPARALLRSLGFLQLGISAGASEFAMALAPAAAVAA